MQGFSADEVRREAEILADLRPGPTAAMLAYCAAVLEAQERSGLRRLHFDTTAEVAVEDGQVGVNITDAARLVGCTRQALTLAVQRGTVRAFHPFVNSGPRVRLADVRRWHALRPERWKDQRNARTTHADGTAVDGPTADSDGADGGATSV